MIQTVCRIGDPGYIYPGSDAHNFEVIGCSSVADILGAGYSTPNELWMRMTHRAPATEHKRIFDRGHAMEPMGSRMIQQDYGRVLVAEQVQYRDPERPWLIYHADGMFPKWSPLNEDATPRDGPGVWEFKAPGSDMAAKMKRDGLSQNYICQVQGGMHVASAALGRTVSWGTAGFIDYDSWELVAFDMAASEKFQRSALQLIDRFHDCLVRDVPPNDITQHEAPAIPEVSGVLVQITDGELPGLAQRLAKIMPDLSCLEKEDKAIRERMKEILAGYEMAEVPGIMKFSYKVGKAGEKIDGEGLLEYCQWLFDEYNLLFHACKAAGLATSFASPKVFRRSDWVTPKAPTRTFRPTPVKG